MPLKSEPERLTSNWLRIAQMPSHIHYVEPSGAHDRDALERAAAKCPFPVDLRPKGLLTFASLEELDAAFTNVCRFTKVQDIAIPDFLEKGALDLNLKPQDASNLLVSMTRQAWIAFAKAQNLIEHQFSGAVGFHAGPAQARVGQRIPWGRQGEKRSAMLRNLAKGAIWQFGVTALPAFWPYPHIKLKARVLFAPPTNDDADAPFEDKAKQHRLRRSVCKGWRNKQWHGRLMAFLECLAAQSAILRLPLSSTAFLHVEASLLLFTSPVSTPLPDALQDEDEEIDPTTLGKPEEDEEETP